MATRTVHMSHRADRRIKIGDNVSAQPAYSAGVEISALPGRHEFTMIDIEKKSGAGAVTLGKPVEVFGERNSKVFYLGTLKNGDDVVVTDDYNHAEPMRFGSLYDKLLVRPASVTGGAYDAYAAHVEVVSGD